MRLIKEETVTWMTARLSVLLTGKHRLFTLVVFTGALCGLAAVCFDLSLRFMERHFVDLMAQLTGWQQIIYTLTLPTLGALLAGLLLYKAVPDARGSGIPQVKVAYETNRPISLKVVIGKFLIGVLSIGTGSSLGREGPTVHICAGLASVFGRLVKLTKKERANLLTVGAAAGIAAAFNAPVAGITFTLEELVGNFSERIHLGSLIIASMIASVIERSILGTHPIFDVPPYGLNRSSELIFYALLGIAGGFVSLGFTQGLLRLRRFFQRESGLPVWLQPAAGGLAVGICALILLRSAGTMGIAGIGYGTLSNVLDARVGLSILMLLLLGKFVATVCCYASGGSGGIFSPVLFIGGALGGVVGYIYSLALHGDTMVPGAFALVGMSAVFAGVIRAPITAILIIFEMTGSYSIVLPLMISSILSYLIASHYQATPIYEALLEQDDIHLPRDEGPEQSELSRYTIAEYMSKQVVALPASLTAAQAYDVACQQRFKSYPVLDTEGMLVCMLPFSRLLQFASNGQRDRLLKDLITREDQHLHPDHTLERAITKMGRAGAHTLPVVSRMNARKVIGVFTINDITRMPVSAPVTARITKRLQENLVAK